MLPWNPPDRSVPGQGKLSDPNIAIIDHSVTNKSISLLLPESADYKSQTYNKQELVSRKTFAPIVHVCASGQKIQSDRLSVRPMDITDNTRTI